MKRSNARLICWTTVILGLLAAVAQAAPVILPAGVYAFDPNRFTGGNTYLGAGIGKTIIRNTSGAAFSYTARIVGQSNIEISGITFDCNGLDIENCSNIALRDCEIINARRTASNHQGLYFGGLTNATFQRITWRNCSMAIQGYGGTNVSFLDFRIEQCTYGFKWGINGVRDCRVERFVIIRDRQMGLEFQGDQAPGSNLHVADGAYVEPELFVDDSKNGNAMAFSIPSSIISGLVAERLYADGYAWLLDANGNVTGERRASSRTWLGLRVGAEVGGSGSIWRNCWFRRLNDPGAVTTSTAVQCTNNRVENCLEGFDWAAPGNGAAARVGAKIDNNVLGVSLPATGGWTLVGVLSGASPATVPTNVPATMPATVPATLPAAQPTTQYVDDPVIKVTVETKSGKVTVTRP